MQVVLDTNIIFKDFRFAGAIPRIILGDLGRVGSNLVFLEVVLDEAKQKFREEFREVATILKDRAAQAARLLGEAVVSPCDGVDPDAASTAYIAWLREKIRGNLHARVTGYPRVTLQQLVARALARKKPFKKDDAGFRDALIWESLIEIAREDADGAPLIFISENRHDFGCESGGLHPDLLAEVEEAGLPANCIRLVHSVRDFFDTYIRPDLLHLDEAKRAIQENRFQGFLPEEWLLERLRAELKDYGFDDDGLIVSQGVDTIVIREVRNIVRFVVVDVSRLADQTLLIELSAIAECDYRFQLRRSAFARLSAAQRASVREITRESRPVEGIATTKLEAYVVLVFDEAATSVTQHSIYDVRVAPPPRQ